MRTRMHQPAAGPHLDLLLGARRDVGDGPARLLLDALLVAGGQQVEQAGQRAAVDDDLQRWRKGRGRHRWASATRRARQGPQGPAAQGPAAGGGACAAGGRSGANRPDGGAMQRAHLRLHVVAGDDVAHCAQRRDQHARGLVPAGTGADGRAAGWEPALGTQGCVFDTKEPRATTKEAITPSNTCIHIHTYRRAKHNRASGLQAGGAASGRALTAAAPPGGGTPPN